MDEQLRILTAKHSNPKNSPKTRKKLRQAIEDRCAFLNRTTDDSDYPIERAETLFRHIIFQAIEDALITLEELGPRPVLPEGISTKSIKAKSYLFESNKWRQLKEAHDLKADAKEFFEGNDFYEMCCSIGADPDAISDYVRFKKESDAPLLRELLREWSNEDTDYC